MVDCPAPYCSEIRYIIWVNGARLKETRERRIAKVVKRIASNIKPGIP